MYQAFNNTEEQKTSSSQSIITDKWAHQDRAIQELRTGIRLGYNRQILMMACGAGKTKVAAKVIKSALAKGKRAGFVIDRLSLLEQTIKAFRSEGITDVGVVQASHPEWAPGRAVQLMSIQTLARRTLPSDFVDLLIIDECHSLHKAHLNLMDQQDVPVIGLSATPFRKGLGLHFERVVKGAVTAELIEKGVLVPSIVYSADDPDVSQIPTVNTADGPDFHQGKADEEMKKLRGHVVDNWMENGENRQTLNFAQSIATSKWLEKQFKRYGVEAVHVDAYSDPEFCEEAIQGFAAGQIKLLTSVNKLSVGFDAPNASCIIFSNITKSLMKHLQAWGRGERACEGKENLLVFDHGGNVERLGYSDDDFCYELDMGEKSPSKPREKEEKVSRKCPSCKVHKPPGTRECPSCGFVAELIKPMAFTNEKLVLKKGERVQKADKQKWYSMLLGYADEKRYSPGWAAHAYREKFGVWPRSLSKQKELPDIEVSSWIRYRNRRKAERKATA